jgi:hypothetical protein
VSAEQSGKAGELPRINLNRAYTTAWHAYRLHRERALKRMNKSLLHRDYAGFNRASYDFDLAWRYQSQHTLSDAWRPCLPPHNLFPL